MQKLETNLASLTMRGDQLAAKRLSAQSTFDTAFKSRQDALLSGDLDDQRTLAKLQSAVDTAASTLVGIDDALATLAQQKSEAERQVAAERERVARAKASEEVLAAINDVEGRITKMLSGNRELGSALMTLEHLSFEAGQLGRYLTKASEDAEMALAVVLPEVQRQSRAIRDGHAPIPLRPTAPEAIAAPEPPPPTMTVFMLRSARYRDHDHRKRFAGQWEDATMPVATAQRALGKGIAVPLTDPRRATHRGMRGGDFTPQASDVVDLDAMPQVETDPVLRATNFTVIDRSAETRTGEITVTRF